ncbi:hypothetical protein ACFMPD_02655 [Sedimentitalea sp. HM32M-2]|uniref:hypothetical protein n=1 Tax=Sedimentitalea sp. HM32M-2 TaxID=3351566 RepID=UPI0036255CCC
MGNGRFGLGRFAISRFASGRFGSTGLAQFGPTYRVGVTGDDGGVARIGTELTASASEWSGAPPASVAWQWQRNGIDIPGATAANYTPVAGDKGLNLRAKATPRESYTPKNSSAFPMQYPAPSAAGTPPAQTYATVSGDQTAAMAGYFTGDDLSYSVGSTIPGVTIDSATGIVTIPTGSDATGTMTVTASMRRVVGLWQHNHEPGRCRTGKSAARQWVRGLVTYTGHPDRLHSVRAMVIIRAS